MTGSIRNFEKLNFTPKSSVFCFSQGQTSKYDRLAQLLMIIQFSDFPRHCSMKLWAIDNDKHKLFRCDRNYESSKKLKGGKVMLLVF